MPEKKRWEMPKVSMGDCVLYSNDLHNFSNPTLGWVMRPPAERTITVLAFTQNGFIEMTSVHHRDDPRLREDHGWQGLGVWEVTEQTKAIYAAATEAAKEQTGGKKQ